MQFPCSHVKGRDTTCSYHDGFQYFFHYLLKCRLLQCGHSRYLLRQASHLFCKLQLFLNSELFCPRYYLCELQIKNARFSPYLFTGTMSPFHMETWSSYFKNTKSFIFNRFKYFNYIHVPTAIMVLSWKMCGRLKIVDQPKPMQFSAVPFSWFLYRKTWSVQLS